MEEKRYNQWLNISNKEEKLVVTQKEGKKTTTKFNGGYTIYCEIIH